MEGAEGWHDRSRAVLIGRAGKSTRQHKMWGRSSGQGFLLKQSSRAVPQGGQLRSLRGSRKRCVEQNPGGSVVKEMEAQKSSVTRTAEKEGSDRQEESQAGPACAEGGTTGLMSFFCLPLCGSGEPNFKTLPSRGRL